MKKFTRFRKSLTLLLSASLVWSSGEGAPAAAGLSAPSPSSSVSPMFTLQALANRPTSFLNSPPAESIGDEFRKLSPDEVEERMYPVPKTPHSAAESRFRPTDEQWKIVTQLSIFLENPRTYKIFR